MSESNFTPGPWRISRYLDSSGHFKNYMIVSDHNDNTICEIPREPLCPPDKQLANAHLLEKVPEMYDKLEHCAKVFEELGMYENRDNIMQLLAQARGVDTALSASVKNNAQEMYDLLQDIDDSCEIDENRSFWYNRIEEILAKVRREANK